LPKSVRILPFRVYEAGAVEAVIGVLQQWNHEAPAVRQQALGLLQNLSAGRTEGRQILASQGADLCVALLNLSFPPEERAADPATPPAPVPQEWRRLITTDEAAAVLSILANLAASEANRGPIASAGAISSLAKLLSSEDAPVVVRSKAKSVVTELAKSAELKARFVEAGLVPVPLIKARDFSTVAKSLGDSPSAQVAAAESARKYKVLPRREGVARLVLMLGLGDPAPVAAAAEEIRDLAVTDQNRQDLSQAGAVPMLVRLLAAGGDEGPGQAGAGADRGVGGLSGENEGQKKGNEDGYAEVARAAAEALSNMCRSKSVRSKVEKAAGVEGLVWLLKTGAEKQRKAAAEALFWLMQEDDGTAEPEAPRQGGSIEGLIDLIVAGKATGSAEEKELQGEGGRAPPLDRSGKLVAAGGLPRLVEMLGEGTPEESGTAASIISRVATEEKGATAAIDAQVVPALERLLSQRVIGANVTSADTISDAEVELSDDEILLRRRLWAAQAAGAQLVASLARHEKTRGPLQTANLHGALSALLGLDVPPEEKEAVSAALVALEQRVDFPSGGPSRETEREIAINVEIPQRLSEMSTGLLPEKERAVIELLYIVKSSSDDEAYLAAVASNGGIFPLVDVLRECSEKCSLAALTILDMLTLDEGNHLVMLEAGAEEVLERIARSNNNHWKLAMRVLRRLPV
jgi:hypothetical protein